LRLGVVGAGRVGQVAHLACYAGLPGVELFLADIRPQLLAEVAARFTVARTFPNHRAMLAAGVDGAIVVVRRPATGPVVLDALRAGVHVLSEKPMALTYEDGLTLVEAARSARRKYGVAYMKRSDAGVAAFRERFALRAGDGSLGELHGVRAWSFGGADGSECGDYLMTPEERPDGLQLWASRPPWLPGTNASAYEAHLNVHSHLTNLVRWIVGTSYECRFAHRDGAATFIEAETSDGLPIGFELRDGVQHGPWKEGVELRFAHGQLRLDLPAPFAVTLAGSVREETALGTETLFVDPQDGAFARQARAFAGWLRHEHDFPSSADTALPDLEFGETVWRRISGQPALALTPARSLSRNSSARSTSV
jgi:predicted dehydrogenase